MKSYRWVLLISSILVWTNACQSPSRSPEVSESWASKMQGLSRSITDLIPYVYNQEAFNSEANQALISDKLKSLARNAHKIDPKSKAAYPAQDPSLKVVAEALNSDIHRAQLAFENGNKEYARSGVKSVLNNCFYCHSRTQDGPQFPKIKDDVAKAQWLAPTEKADLYVAFREYDAALDTLAQYLRSYNDLPVALLYKEKALARYLAIAIRVKADPQLAESGIDQLLNQPGLAPYLMEDVMAWRASVRAWSQEKKMTKNKSKAALSLIERAKARQEYPRDRAAYVEYLRASQLLHDAINLAASAQERARTLFLLGETYEVLTDFGFWMLNETYYEACIRELPHSEQAAQCYRRLEESVLLGYSGSLGTFVPEGVRGHLEILRKMAFKKSAKAAL